MKILGTLQVYRALAALLVVAVHARNGSAHFTGRPLDLFSQWGNAGVYFFFLLSGFVMLWVHQRDFDQPARVGRYFRKRIIRVYPVYVAVTLAVLPFWLFVPSFGEPHHRQLVPLIKSLLLWPQAHKPHLSVGWTLTYEVVFYLVFAVFLLSRKAGFMLLCGWVAGIAVIAARATDLSFPASFFLDPLNLFFPLGMLAALAVRRLPFLSGTTGVLAFVAGNALFILGLLPANLLPVALSPLPTFGAASFLILAGSTARAVEGFFQKRRILLFLGGASYSIYLAHDTAIVFGGNALLVAGFWAGMSPWTGFLVLAAIGVAAGIGLHLVVERPLLAWLGKKFDARRSLATAPHADGEAA